MANLRSVAAMFCFAGGSLFAQEPSLEECLALANPPPCCVAPCGCETPDFMITPPWTPFCKNEGILIEADFLYWKAQEDNLIVAETLKLRIEPGSGESVPFKEKAIDIPFKWDPGFRVKLSGLIPYDGWRAAIQWTDFHTHPSIPLRSGTFLPELFFSVEVSEGITLDFKADWSLKLDDLEFIFSRSFSLSNSLTLSPFFGARNAWVRQKLKASYFHILNFPMGVPVDVADGFQTIVNNFWGIGPTFGSQAQWLWRRGFFSDFGMELSILSGHFKTKNQAITFEKSTDEDRPFILLGNYNRIRPVLGLNLGIGWAACFWCDRFIKLTADYEMQIWWSQIQFQYGDPHQQQNNDLSLQGLTLRVEFGF